MKVIHTSQNLILATTIFLVFVVPLRAQVSDSEEYLAAHNKARAEVGVGPLEWDTTLEAYAQKSVNSRINNCRVGTVGFTKGPYGENVARCAPESMCSPSFCVNLWLQEKVLFDNNSRRCAAEFTCQHYTQAVWRKSKRIGCAKAKCAGDTVYVQCNYDPPGNYFGQKPF